MLPVVVAAQLAAERTSGPGLLSGPAGLALAAAALVAAVIAVRKGRRFARAIAALAVIVLAFQLFVLIMGGGVFPPFDLVILATLLAASASLLLGGRSRTAPPREARPTAPRTAAPAGSPSPGRKGRPPPAAPSSGRIFLSYRREDAPFVVGRLHDRLAAHFGRDAVFKDVDSIPPGVDFRRFIHDAIAASGVVLAVIGEHWQGAATGDGRPKLEQDADFVRIELTSALRVGVPVIPVLVRATPQPLPQDLPGDLRALGDIQAARLREDPDFHGDVDRLIDGIERLLARVPAG